MLVLINVVLNENITKILEKKGQVTSTDPYGWFQWYSRYGDFQMMKDRLKNGEEL